MDTKSVLKELDKLTNKALDKILQQDFNGGMELINKKDEILLDLMDYIKANPEEYNYIVIPTFYELESHLQYIGDCLLDKYKETLSSQESAQVRACNEVSKIRNYIYVYASLRTKSEINSCIVSQGKYSRTYLLTGDNGKSVRVKIFCINKTGKPWFFIPSISDVER